MRSNTSVFFRSLTPGEYDYTTGNYDPDTPVETLRYAAVTDAKQETVRLLYGELRQGVLIVRLQDHYDTPFADLRIGDKIYKVDYSRKLEHKHIFYVTEVK